MKNWLLRGIFVMLRQRTECHSNLQTFAGAMMIRFATLLVFLLFLTGCGSVPKIDIEPHTLAQIRTITVINPPEIKGYAYWSEDTPVFFGGLALANQGDQKKRLTEAILAQGHPTVIEALIHNTVSRLQQLGFTVNVENASWEKKDNSNYVLEFEKIRSRSDASLVIYPRVAGFVEPACTASSVSDCPGFVPTILVMADLVDRDKKTLLYRGFHRTGLLAKRPRMLSSYKGWRETPYTVNFENFDALLSNPKATTQALIDATSGIAATIAEYLQPQAPRP
jgi:hypothetical protein